MRAQRVRVAESRIEMQVVKWAAEGMVKGEKSAPAGCRVRERNLEYSMTWGIRQLHGICWYPDKGMGLSP